MNTDGNIHALNKHIDKMERDDMRDEAIEYKAIELYDELKRGEIVYVNCTHYSLDDFTADFDIDSSYFSEMLRGDAESMTTHANEKLNDWCKELATEYIDNL